MLYSVADPGIQFGAHGERSAESEPITGVLGVEPPAGSRGRATGREVRGQAPLKLKAF